MSRCLTLGAASSRVPASIQVATCTGWTAAIDGTADELAADDYNGVAVWRRIRDAVAQLTNKTPPGPVH